MRPVSRPRCCSSRIRASLRLSRNASRSTCRNACAALTGSGAGGRRACAANRTCPTSKQTSLMSSTQSIRPPKRKTSSCTSPICHDARTPCPWWPKSAPTTNSRSSPSPEWAASTSSAASAPSPNSRSPASSGNRNSSPPAGRDGSRLRRLRTVSGTSRPRDCGDCDCCRGWCGPTGRGDWSPDCRRCSSARSPRVRSRWPPSTIWLFADTMGPWRMSAATVLSIVAMILWLILDHELWERPKSPDGA